MLHETLSNWRTYRSYLSLRKFCILGLSVITKKVEQGICTRETVQGCGGICKHYHIGETLLSQVIHTQYFWGQWIWSGINIFFPKNLYRKWQRKASTLKTHMQSVLTLDHCATIHSVENRLSMPQLFHPCCLQRQDIGQWGKGTTGEKCLSHSLVPCEFQWKEGQADWGERLQISLSFWVLLLHALHNLINWMIRFHE